MIFQVTILLTFILGLSNGKIQLRLQHTSAFQYAFRDETTDQDVNHARQTLLSEKMNPLSVSSKTLLVAYDLEEPDKIIGFGQIRPTSDKNYQELASLFVRPEYRNQGVGSALIERLLQKFDSEPKNKHTTCCLLTLRPTIPLYSKYGFVEVTKDIPPPLKMEYKAGQLLSFLLGNDLVCMLRQK